MQELIEKSKILTELELSLLVISLTNMFADYEKQQYADGGREMLDLVLSEKNTVGLMTVLKLVIEENQQPEKQIKKGSFLKKKAHAMMADPDPDDTDYDSDED